MEQVKQQVAVAVLAALALLAGGWFLLVSPVRGEAAALREQAVLQKGTNASLETSLEVLRTRAERLPEKQAELAEIARRIPPGPALPELLRALEGAAAKAGVTLTSVVPAPPLAVEAPAAPAPVDGAPAPDPAAAVPAAPAAPPVVGVSSMEVKLVVVGDFYAVEHFIVLLEELPRALRVTALSMDQGGDDAGSATTASERAVRASLTGLVYLAPAAAATTAPTDGAVPALAGTSATTPAS